MIDVHLALHKVEEAREELRKSLKRRKEIAIAENDINYRDIDTTQVFANGDIKEFDASITELMEKNRVQVEEIRSLKMEHESQAIMLCEITEQKKRVVEDRFMMEDEKRNLANKLEEKYTKLTRISNMQIETIAQMMNLHYELNMKDIEISTLKMKNEKLQNDLKREKEILESFNKPNKAIKYFEQLLKSPTSSHDTQGLGYTNTEEGESSKTGEERNKKGKKTKPTCHFYGKKGHTSNVCKRKNAHQHDKPKSASYFDKCKNQGNQAHECRNRTIKTSRFEGHYYNYKKYGHKSFECRSNPMWTPNHHARRNNYVNHYN